jgi:hypothetical protein
MGQRRRPSVTTAEKRSLAEFDSCADSSKDSVDIVDEFAKFIVQVFLSKWRQP